MKDKTTIGRGMFWTGLEKVLMQGFGFLQGVLLARMLCPADFGMTAMLGLFIGLGITLAESGLGTAYVVYGGNARKVLAWNIGLSVFLYSVLFVSAPFIASFYHEDALCSLVRVMGLGLVLNAACVVGGAQLQRAQRFREIATVNTVSTLVSFCVGVGLAWCGAGVWAIVGVGLTAAAVRLLCLMPYVRLPTDDAAIGPLLSYGGKLMVSGIVHTVYTNCYQLVIGKMLSPSFVGLYVRGQRWAQLPSEIVNDVVGRVALPVLAGERVERLGGGGFVVVNAALLWPGLVVLWIWAPEIVGLVLGEQWLDCVPYLRILLVGQLFAPVVNIALTVIRASGHSEMLLQADAVKKPLGLLALVVGVHFGLAGICWAAVASDFVEVVTDLCFVWRIKRNLRQSHCCI